MGLDYAAIIEQGGFGDDGESELCLAACGRIVAALERGQIHFDEMEVGHQRMLSNVLAVIIYHRAEYG